MVGSGSECRLLNAKSPQVGSGGVTLGGWIPYLAKTNVVTPYANPRLDPDASWQLPFKVVTTSVRIHSAYATRMHTARAVLMARTATAHCQQNHLTTKFLHRQW